MKIIYKILIGLIIALGIIHILTTFGAYDKLSADAIWFAGAGAAIIFAGFLNIVLLRSVIGKDRFVRTLYAIANLVTLAVFVLLLLIFPAPNLFLGAGLFVAATLFSLRFGSVSYTEII